MARRFDLVVMAASIGGIAAYAEILSHLPRDFPLPIVIVQHRDPAVVSILDEILARRTPLRVKHAKVGERPVAGTVYVAPTDVHLSFAADGSFTTMNGRRIRHVLSSANPLFESAARVFRDGVIAVVLTGYDSDGTDGVQAVRAMGGRVIAQDEATSTSFGMPKSAIATGAVGAVLPLSEIAPALIRMAKRTGEGRDGNSANGAASGRR
jgi:two-component system, chemotaxis family, protein-glutamate methylesterase/glutaminase